MPLLQPSTNTTNRRLRWCRFLALDFDGVFTDNKVYIDENGKEMIRCDRSDTFGLNELKEFGVDVMVISTEKNNIVKHRAKKLGIYAINGLEDKGAQLQIEMDKRGVKRDETVYVGNDVNDLSCFEVAGTTIAVADSYPTLIEQADIVTKNSGGDGAVREVIKLILDAKKRAD